MESVTADLDNDLLRVQFDPAKVSPRQMLQAVDKQGFAAEVRKEEEPPPP